jgi:mRNA interferase YafQ
MNDSPVGTPIKSDLILIYRKPDPESLERLRFGSHSELGL